MDVRGSSSSSSSSSYLFHNVGGSTLHSVRKPVTTKPWKKLPVAPLPRSRPRVYRVDPVNFRDLVQKLTGTNEIYDHRLPAMAPTPLTVSNLPLPEQLQTTVSSVEVQKMNEGMEGPGFLGLNLSPSSPNWFHLPTLDII